MMGLSFCVLFPCSRFRVSVIIDSPMSCCLVRYVFFHFYMLCVVCLVLFLFSFAPCLCFVFVCCCFVSFFLFCVICLVVMFFFLLLPCLPHVPFRVSLFLCCRPCLHIFCFCLICSSFFAYTISFCCLPSFGCSRFLFFRVCSFTRFVFFCFHFDCCFRSFRLFVFFYSRLLIVCVCFVIILFLLICSPLSIFYLIVRVL